MMVVGIPYISNFDLLEECIGSLKSASRIHIIDNSPELGRLTYDTDYRIRVTRPWHNIGVGASWNFIIKANPDARYWVIINADLKLGPTALDIFARGMKLYEMMTFRGLHAFAVRASAIQKVGWFDENFVPAYFEDNDWSYRARLLGVHIEQVDGDFEHDGSATIKNDDGYRAENARTFPLNERYYERKWGGSVGHEVYTTPFNQGGSPRDWTLDMTRLANQAWKE
jgi:GT2 family glycosyltransferase